MIKDIYSRNSQDPKFDENIVEVSDGLSQLILKIENVLFTRKGDVLGAPGFGCNIEDLVFTLVLNESVIAQRINSQIQSYCVPDQAQYSIDTRVKFYSTLERNGALVDIFVNEQKVIGALF